MTRRRLPRHVAPALLLFASCASAPSYPDARIEARRLLDDSDPQAAAIYVDGLDSETAHDTPLLFLRAEAAARAGDYSGAAARFRQIADITRIDTLRDLALRNVATVQLQAGHPVEAYDALTQLSEQSLRAPEVQRELGVAAVAAGRLDLAREHFASLPDAEQREIAQVLGADFLATR